ncbi:vasoactive intestinal polypeptide receptor 2 [Stegastes partitus]|uniref:Vasoactive intestinal polypeptide receptor 2 n=1 Tax=Stegastes partitus TaxID=144197 RepID=A0A9Y4KD10_9TELE|nr:PREDICTED: vasoactive intestinal polypeptide receptor 2 [Stegastes partitus]
MGSLLVFTVCLWTCPLLMKIRLEGTLCSDDDVTLNSLSDRETLEQMAKPNRRSADLNVEKLRPEEPEEPEQLGQVWQRGPEGTPDFKQQKEMKCRRTMEERVKPLKAASDRTKHTRSTLRLLGSKTTPPPGFHAVMLWFGLEGPNCSRSSIKLSLVVVSCRHPSCNFLLEVERDQAECVARLTEEEAAGSRKEPGCRGMWDNIACWEPSAFGETATIACPRVLRTVFGRNGNISRNCTAAGWSEVFPNISSVCGSDTSQDKLVFYLVVQTLYTLGHSLSLIALTTGSAILCLFRKLHCTRNYIHLNLFVSFILRAVAVLVKDDIVFSRTSQCSNQPSLVGCKASLVFFQYFIMANFFWLLVEGLYLHTLLVVIFSENRHFIVYMFIGWGIPTVFVSAWVVTRIYLEDTGCWERNDNPIPNWVINGPIGFSIMVNFIQFISIIRILVQKLRCPDVGGNDQSQYRRLAKSTLLLIPLFGIHYVVFVSLSESIAEDYRIFFDLALGSFQGLVVAILYCFLNSEVQGELKRKWRSMCLNCRLSRNHHFGSTFTSRNGSDHMVQFHRNSRTQSIMQSETTVL